MSDIELLHVETWNFELKLLHAVCFQGLLSFSHVWKFVQNNPCKTIWVRSTTFGGWTVPLRACQSLIIPSQEHVCSLLMQFTGCTHSQQIHNCRGPGNNSASQIRDSNTCTQKYTPCPSVTHTHRQKHTTESLFKKETLVTKSALADLSVKILPFALLVLALIYVQIARMESAITQLLSQPSILKPPDTDAPECPKRTKHIRGRDHREKHFFLRCGYKKYLTTPPVYIKQNSQNVIVLDWSADSAASLWDDTSCFEPNANLSLTTWLNTQKAKIVISFAGMWS